MNKNDNLNFPFFIHMLEGYLEKHWCLKTVNSFGKKGNEGRLFVAAFFTCVS